MNALEQLLGLFVAAVILAGAARRAGAPYPVFLALGGALLALLPVAPSFTLPPELALALFVAPVLLDAAYDTSLRDLRENWAPVTGLVIGAVGCTTVAVAIVAHALVPSMPWAASVALGAIVAPPDAVAATAVLRPLRPPHRILTVLEGESLLNDASALLVYRLALGAVAASSFSLGSVAPTFLFAIAGSVVAGPALGWFTLRLMDRVRHVPTAIILQFVTTFGVWILAEQLGLSGVLTMVCYAMAVAQTAPARIPAWIRIPTYAVWDTVVFALNILAFIFIGLQVGPILESLQPAEGGRYFAVAGAVLLTVIVVRLAWHMTFNAVIRWRHRRFGFHPPRPMLRPTVGSGLIISWAGMRGIVSLAAAMALPSEFPYRDLIVLTAFSVVLGTLVIQGLTLKPLLLALDVRDDDPVGRERLAGRDAALRAALASFAHDDSPLAHAVRHEFTAHLASGHADTEAGAGESLGHGDLHRRAVRAARQSVIAMRANREIGDDAFHQIEEDLDWLEMAGGAEESGDEDASPGIGATQADSRTDIAGLENALDAAEQDARSLVADLTEDLAAWRAEAGSWSVAECLDHLAIANRTYIAAMTPNAERALKTGRRRRRPAVPGIIGGWFVRTLEPPVKPLRRGRAPRIIRPRAAPSLNDAMGDFIGSQNEVRAFLQRFADVDLAGVHFPNPFVRVVRFSLATGLHVIGAHERRHLWQARRVRQAAESSSDARESSPD